MSRSYLPWASVARAGRRFVVSCAAALFVGLFAGPAVAADCNPGEYLVDDQGNPLCWPNGMVQVCFNDALDPVMLDVPNGPNLRWAAFQQAVAQWNAALVAVNSAVVLVPARNVCWAIDQADSSCTDPAENNHPVYGYTWIDDMSNDASTGKPTKAPPGWVKDPGEGIIQYSQIPDNLKTEILARTRVQGANGTITRADIGWMTHVETIVDCPGIPWNYDSMKPPVNFATEFDFYSVMLHELGHLLGLGHLEAGETGVMQPSIDKGTRQVITDEERECLKKCVGVPVPTAPASWGQIKSLFK